MWGGIHKAVQGRTRQWRPRAKEWSDLGIPLASDVVPVCTSASTYILCWPEWILPTLCIVQVCLVPLCVGATTSCYNSKLHLLWLNSFNWINFIQGVPFLFLTSRQEKEVLRTCSKPRCRLFSGKFIFIDAMSTIWSLYDPLPHHKKFFIDHLYYQEGTCITLLKWNGTVEESMKSSPNPSLIYIFFKNSSVKPKVIIVMTKFKLELFRIFV